MAFLGWCVSKIAHKDQIEENKHEQQLQACILV